MENEKLFEFMEKMYSEMQGGFNELRQDINGLKQDITGLKQEVRKNSIRLDSLEKKADIMVEVQSNHMHKNEKNHVDIVEMLSGEIELTKKAVSKVTVIK